VPQLMTPDPGNPPNSIEKALTRKAPYKSGGRRQISQVMGEAEHPHAEAAGLDVDIGSSRMRALHSGSALPRSDPSMRGHAAAFQYPIIAVAYPRISLIAVSI
jgi:hypothetical protein